MKRFACLLAAALVLVPSVARAAHVKVFVMSGQSNMVGYGDGTALDPSLASQMNVWYDHRNPDQRMGGEYANTMSTDWGPLTPKGATHHYGPEITFGHDLAAALPGSQIAIVKMSQGGTNIPGHWARGLPPDNMFLYKSQLYHALLGALDSATYSQANNNALAYPNETTRLDTAIARLMKANADWELAGFIWMQGENEAGWNAALKYQQRLTDLVAALRKDTNAAALPVVIGRISDNLYAKNGGPLPASADMYIDAVRKAQVDFVTADGHAAWIDTDDLTPKSGEPYHFDSAGYQTLGQRFAKAWLTIAPPDGGGGAGGASASSATATSGSAGGAVGGMAGTGGRGAGEAPGPMDAGGSSCGLRSDGNGPLGALAAAIALVILVARSRR